MKRTNSKNFMKLTLAIGAVWWLTGCGSSTTTGENSFSAASNSGCTSNCPSPPVVTGDAVATCSKDTAGFSDFQVEVMQYSSNRPDLARVKIINAPADFLTGDWEVMMYRWMAASDGSTSIDSTPLSFQFERKDAYAAFQPIISSPATSFQAFYGSQIQAMVDYANQYTGLTPLSGASATAFFQGATFLVSLNDLTSSYQVLRVTLKNAGAVMKEVDVLIPSFQADPAKYAADSRHPGVLQQLHPQKSKLGGSWTQNQYAEFARAACF